MGWYATDLTGDSRIWGRHITEDSWMGHKNEVPAPVLSGAGSIWIGAFEDEADDLCWLGGLGYGNGSRQRAVSPVLSVTIPEPIHLSFRYFNDTEPSFDYTRILLRRLPGGSETTLPPHDGLHDRIGLAPDSPVNPPVGAVWDGQITPAVLQGATQFQLVFEFEADGFWSDADGSYETDFGPFAADDIVLTGGANATFDFETDVQGWSFESVPGTGTHFGVADRGDYDILDPCGCGLSGNLLEFHDELRIPESGGSGHGGSRPLRTHRDAPAVRSDPHRRRT
jgi:hypothetical protein